MKKLFVLVLAVGGLSIAVSSCSKEHTCSCTILGFTSDTTFTDMSKSDAKTQCDNLNTAAALVGGSCELK
jgi:hypothetical protein